MEVDPMEPKEEVQAIDLLRKWAALAAQVAALEAETRGFLTLPEPGAPTVTVNPSPAKVQR
ncbi:MAG TPA: hypothetical protein VFJ64_10685 [Solirubrobacterales bacterium]|nr:hypothetical protein [Solirubrobacterales bacterium]